MKIKLSVAAATLLISSSLYGVNVSAGWTLLGSDKDGVNASFGNDTNINSVWKYNDGWSATSPNGDLTQQLNGVIDPLSTINAGEGFWINTKVQGSVTISGTDAADENLSLKSGWQLLSLKGKNSISVASVFNDSSKITTVWKYTSSGWQAYSPQTTLATTLSEANIALLDIIDVNEGFWVNASGETDVLDSPPIVGGQVSLEGLEDDSQQLGKVLYDTTTVFEGSVQLYNVNDTSYENPLLDIPVSLNDDGSYTVTEADFKVGVTPSADGAYIIRVIVKKAGDDTPVELSAVKTKNENVEVSPITSAVKSKIIETINTFFTPNEDGSVELSADILTTVNTLAKLIVEQVKKDVESGELEFKKNNFAAQKTLEEEQGITDQEEKKKLIAAQKAKEEKLKSQLESEGSAGATVAILTTKIAEEKEKEIVQNNKAKFEALGDNVKDFKTDQSLDIAQFTYKTVSTIAKTGMAVHSGDGRVIVFLPVPSEEFNTLPGSKYSIKVTLDDNSTKEIGDDPALRILDVNSDLKNVSGFESWTHNIRDMFDTPVMPFEAIKLMMKNAAAGTTVNLMDFGNVFTAQYDMYDTSASGETTTMQNQLFDTNPLSVLSDTNVTEASDIISKYSKTIITKNYDWLFWDYFWHNYDEAMMNGGMNDNSTEITSAVTKFLDTFGVQSEDQPGEVKSTLYTRIKDDTKSNLKEKLFSKFGKLLNATVPYDVEDVNGTLLQFGKENGVIVDDKTVIKPMTSFALTNVVMETADFGDNMQLVKKELKQVFPFLEGQIDSTILQQEVWFPDYSQNMEGNMKVLFDENGQEQYTFSVPTTQEILNQQKFNRDFVLAIISKAIGQEISSSDMESTYSKVLVALSEVMPDFIEKIETAQFNEQNQGGFDQGYGETGQKVTTVKFKMKNNQGQDNQKIAKVKFVPMADHKQYYSWEELTDAATFFVKNNNTGYFENNVTVTQYDTLVDGNLTLDSNGLYHQTDMFAVYAYEGTEEFFVGHFPIFPQDVNDLHELWFDATMFNDEFTNGDYFTGGFHEYPVNFNNGGEPANGVNYEEVSTPTYAELFYPFLNTNNGEQVGENILKLTKDAGGEFTLTPTTNLVGTLQDSTIELFVLAKTWNENNEIWMANNFGPKDSNVSSISIGYDLDGENTYNDAYDINEGGMILIKIDSPSLQGTKLIGTVDWIGENEAKLFVEPVPMFDTTMGGAFDYWETNSTITKIKANIKTHDGLPNLDVTEINYKTMLGCSMDNGNYMQYPIESLVLDNKELTLAGTITKKSASFEKSGVNIINPTLMFTYDETNGITLDQMNGTCNFNGDISIELKGSKDGEEFTEPFGHFWLGKQDENYMEFWWEKWDDNYDEWKEPYYDPQPMFPETDDFQTTVKFQVKTWDPQANNNMGADVLNNDIEKIILTRVLQDDAYNWITLNNVDSMKYDVNLSELVDFTDLPNSLEGGGFELDVLLQPEGTIYNENGEIDSTGKFKETGHFKFEVVTKDGEQYDIGWFPLLAQEMNYLEWIHFDSNMYQNYDDDYLSYWDVLHKLQDMGQWSDVEPNEGGYEGQKQYILFDSKKMYSKVSVNGDGNGTIVDYHLKECGTSGVYESETLNFTYSKTSTNGEPLKYELYEEGETEKFMEEWKWTTQHTVNFDGTDYSFKLHQVVETEDNASSYIDDIAYLEGNDLDAVEQIVKSMIFNKVCTDGNVNYKTGLADTTNTTGGN